MVIDTSAIFAAITGEPDSGVYRNAIISASLRLISAVTLLETQIVLVSRSGSNSIVILHELIERAGIVVVPFDGPMAEAAFDAFKRYGKGKGHKAQLNVIDCAAYAPASQVPNIIYDVVLGGALTSAVVPVLAGAAAGRSAPQPDPGATAEASRTDCERRTMPPSSSTTP